MATCDPRDFPACHPRDFPGYRPDPLDCKRAIDQCFTKNYGPVQIGGYSGVGEVYAVRGFTQQQALATVATGPQFFRDVLSKVLAAAPKELFPGAVLAANIAVSVGVGAAGLPAAVSASLNAAQTLARPNMALNLSGILGAAGGIIGGINTSGFGNISQILGPGLQLAGAALAPQAPSYVQGGMIAGPVYSGAPNYPTPQAIPVSNRQIATRAPEMTGDVFNAASRMLQALGIAPPSVSAFYSASKRALSALASLARRTPSGTLVSLLIGLGLAANEAGVLTGWWATKGLKRRRMNPANSKALRRAARRIKSFHRLCVHTDVLKSRGRSRGRRCTTCRKSPCMC